MAIVRAWLRIDLRRRWRSLAVLALLVAVSGGTVMTAVAGARRGESALSRLAADTLPATALVQPNEPGFDWDAVRALPEVEAVGPVAGGRMNIRVEGLGDEEVVGVPGVGRELLFTIERPAVLAGRMLDPARADEAVVTPEFEERFGIGVGDSVTLRLYTPEQVRSDDDPGEPAGPRVPVTVVGVVRTVAGGTLDAGRPTLQTSPALYERYGVNFVDPEIDFFNAVVRLRGGERSLPAFQVHLAQAADRTDIGVSDLVTIARRAQRSFAFQARCLFALGIAALVAALFLVGQAVARFTAAGVTDLQVLRALGMAPRQAALAAAAGPFLAALVGATAGVAVAAVASRWFPIGSAARMEPTPGVVPDRLVLGTGLVAVPLVVLAGSLAAAWLALGAQRGLPGSGRRSGVATAAASVGLPVPVVVGTRFALEAGRGRTSIPVRPALVGAVAGVLGVVGALTFSAGVADAAEHPARFGQTWQLWMFTGFGGQLFHDPDEVYTAIAGDRDVAGVDDAWIGIAHAGDNATAMSLYTQRSFGRPLDVVLTAGRMPRSATEVVLAPSSATAIGARVGSRIPVTGSARSAELTVTGVGFVPVGPHNDYDTGGWVTEEGYHGLFDDDLTFRAALIALRPGVDPDAAAGRLREVVGAFGGGGAAHLGPTLEPSAVGELREVRVLPVALGAFLVLLAVGAVGHALATAVRRRRHDVAVLRALGMTRRQSRGVVVTQASVLAVVGLLFGVPLGLALGRTLWRVVADYTPLEYVPPVALWALLLVAPLTLLLANLLAAWPGHQAARLRVGHVLRAE
jgi:hypothetical protein